MVLQREGSAATDATPNASKTLGSAGATGGETAPPPNAASKSCAGAASGAGRASDESRLPAEPRLAAVARPPAAHEPANALSKKEVAPPAADACSGDTPKVRAGARSRAAYSANTRAANTADTAATRRRQNHLSHESECNRHVSPRLAAGASAAGAPLPKAPSKSTAGKLDEAATAGSEAASAADTDGRASADPAASGAAAAAPATAASPALRAGDGGVAPVPARERLPASGPKLQLLLEDF